MKNLLCVLFAFALISTASGQTGDTIVAVKGDTRVIVSPQIEYMVERHRELNRKGGVMAGYRIQIYASSVMGNARSQKAKFDSRFPQYNSQIVLEEPDFKLVVGRYVDRFDAWRDLQQILGNFPGAFIRRDLIDIADL